MEQCDFRSILSAVRSYISDDSGLNQIDLLYALFASFMGDDASIDFDLDGGLVCRWFNGQARVSPRITGYYHAPQNRKKLASDIESNILPVLYDSVMAVQMVHELLAQHGKVFLCGIAGIGKSELAKAYAKMHKASINCCKGSWEKPGWKICWKKQGIPECPAKRIAQSDKTQNLPRRPLLYGIGQSGRF